MQTKKRTSTRGIRVDHARLDVVGLWLVFKAGSQEIVLGPMAPESKPIADLVGAGLDVVDNRGH